MNPAAARALPRVMTSPSDHPEADRGREDERPAGEPSEVAPDGSADRPPDRVPEALRTALAERTTAGAPRSPRDLELQAAVQRHFRGAGLEAAVRRRGRRVGRRRIAVAVAAAAAVIFLAVQLPFLGAVDRTADPADVDGDGRVDMLDAFVLARGLANGRLLPARHDLDGSGTVDARDVDAVAQRAVALERPGGVEASS